MDDASLAQDAAINPVYQYLLQFGGGGIAGIAVGYALKVAFKAAMFVLGAILIVLYVLNDAGFITVNWGAVSRGLENGAMAGGRWCWRLITGGSVPFVGFGAGAWFGWKRLGR